MPATALTTTQTRCRHVPHTVRRVPPKAGRGRLMFDNIVMDLRGAIAVPYVHPRRAACGAVDMSTFRRCSSRAAEISDAESGR